jgi:tRNA-dihydrouridine synthase B
MIDATIPTTPEQKLLRHLKSHPFVLAPMAGITDKPFRVYMKKMGAHVVISELVSANGIKYAGEKTLRLLSYDEVERPIGLQLFGEDPEVLALAAKKVEDLGADFIDLNFGCPVKKVVTKGAGAAVLRDLNQLRAILRSVKGAVNIPVTIKIRTGWEQSERNAIEVIKVAHDEGITWVSIHGRTRSQGYSGLADWDYIASVKAVSPLPVIGNGDIHTAEQAEERRRTSGCDAVMIGRGALKNPWIFAEAQNLFRGLPPETGISYNFVAAFNALKDELVKSCDDRTVMIQLRKFSMWYSAGYPESSQFRNDIFSTRTVDETYDRILHYYSNLDQFSKADTSHEAFLMGGHG